MSHSHWSSPLTWFCHRLVASQATATSFFRFTAISDKVQSCNQLWQSKNEKKQKLLWGAVLLFWDTPKRPLFLQVQHVTKALYLLIQPRFLLFSEHWDQGFEIKHCGCFWLWTVAKMLSLAMLLSFPDSYTTGRFFKYHNHHKTFQLQHPGRALKCWLER